MLEPPSPSFLADKHAPSRTVTTSDFAERLRRLRIAAGYETQPELARAVGINALAVSRHETGRATPSAETMEAYARVLGVSVAYLQLGVGDPKLPSTLETYLRSDEGKRLHPEVRKRLRLFPWTLLSKSGEPSRFQVRGVAYLIGEGLDARQPEQLSFLDAYREPTLPKDLPQTPPRGR